MSLKQTQFIECDKCKGHGKNIYPIIIVILTLGAILFYKSKCKKCKGTGFCKIYSKGI